MTTETKPKREQLLLGLPALFDYGRTPEQMWAEKDWRALTALPQKTRCHWCLVPYPKRDRGISDFCTTECHSAWSARYRIGFEDPKEWRRHPWNVAGGKYRTDLDDLDLVQRGLVPTCTPVGAPLPTAVEREAAERERRAIVHKADKIPGWVERGLCKALYQSIRTTRNWNDVTCTACLVIGVDESLLHDHDLREPA